MSDPPLPQPPRQSALRTAAAGLIGNVLEWFDFAVYGYFASDIGRLFFPAEDPTASTLLSYAVFLLGFILGSASAFAVSQVLGPAEAAAWGWRVPFVASREDRGAAA